MYRTLRIFQIIFFLSFIFSGCESRSTSSQKDDLTQTESAHDTPSVKKERIISMAPNITEFLFALDQGEKVVGVTKFCNFPERVKSLPKVGGLNDTDLESILSLKPTLVIGVKSAQSEPMKALLEKANIDSLWIQVETVDDVLNTPSALATKLPIPHAAEYTAQLSQKLRPILTENGSQKRLRVLILFGANPYIAAGPKTYVSELVARAGADNILKAGPSYPQLDSEKIVELDPDIVLDLSYGNGAVLPKIPKSQKMRKVVRLENLDLARPSPRIDQFYTFLKTTFRHAKNQTEGDAPSPAP